MRCAISMARPLPPVSPCAPWLCSGISTLRGRTRRDDPTRRSPFHDLNGFEYHPNWLHNLLIASSMGGRKL